MMASWATTAATVATLLVAVAAVDETLSKTFDYFQCYNMDATKRMPNTLDNLLGMLDKFENQSTSYINPDEMAERIIKRYRTDGIVYAPKTDYWMVGDIDKETEKQDLIFKVTKPSLNFNKAVFDSREECGLHMLVSHSTDNYPYSGVNDIWDGTISRANRGDVNRKKRDAFSASSSSSSYSSGSSSPSSFSSSGNANSERIYSGSGSDPNARGMLAYQPALHPIENGVMETQYGPVAAGTLLTGLMAITDKATYTLGNLLDDTTYMPTEMKSKVLKPVYTSSLSGDMGQMALAALIMEKPSTQMGPSGRYHNCTTCAKQYSLETMYYTLLSRAELNAGIDVMLINKAYNDGGGNIASLSLPQLLKLYYSNKGLPFDPETKACNRMRLYNQLNKNEIKDQALNFMYAYQNDFKSLRDKIAITNKFPEIETAFKKYLVATVQVVENFINSYNYDDEGYSRCGPSTTSNSGSSWQNYQQVPLSETQTDLIAVYADIGSDTYSRDQRQMIADLSRRLRMNSATSTMGVMRGTDAVWVLPYTNVTNVGDWACNFTTDYVRSGSSGSRNDAFTLVIEQLTNHYAGIYKKGREHEYTSSGRSQVVVWQVPGTVEGDESTNNITIQVFRENYPDVRIIFVGKNRNTYAYLLDDEDDFLVVLESSINQVSETAVSKVQDSPRFFMYPACDPNNPNITNIDNYREDSHTYRGAVTPNFTTYIRIPAANFQYSEEVTLKISGNNLRMCGSRTNRYANEDYSVENINNEYIIGSADDTLKCAGGETDESGDSIIYTWPCDRYLYTCNPIYLSITTLTSRSPGSSTKTGCSDSNRNCEFPNQVPFELSHEGMTCGASTSVPTALLCLLLPAIVQRLRH